MKSKLIKDEKNYCSQMSIDREEQITGTMSIVKCFLLIEYSGQWSPRINTMLQDSDINQKSVTHILNFIDWCPEPVRLLFIKNKSTKEKNEFKIFLTRENKGEVGVTEFDLQCYNDIKNINLKSAYKEIGSSQNLLVICTHGKRDKCCAKFGYPVYSYLSSNLILREKSYSIWECTHVGGDRFAANIIWLPYGIGFGHCQNFTNLLFDNLKKHELSLIHYRGSSIFPSAAQYFEAHVRKQRKLSKPGGVIMTYYREESNKNRELIADIGLVFKDLDNKLLTATVREYQDKSRGKVLASCNNNGYAYPRRFILESINGLN